MGPLVTNGYKPITSLHSDAPLLSIKVLHRQWSWVASALLSSSCGELESPMGPLVWGLWLQMVTNGYKWLQMVS